jgi:hypothetical protein
VSQNEIEETLKRVLDLITPDMLDGAVVYTKNLNTYGEIINAMREAGDLDIEKKPHRGWEQHHYDESSKLRPGIVDYSNRENLIIAEIGVWKGVNAYNMLTQLDVAKIYLIDPYIPYRGISGRIGMSEAATQEVRAEAMERLAPFENRIVWLEKESSQAAFEIPENSLDIVYIDGDHRYEMCLADVVLYYQKVKPGGLMSGDDYRPRCLHDVIRAVNEFVLANRYKLTVREAVWWFTKREAEDVQSQGAQTERADR